MFKLPRLYAIIDSALLPAKLDVVSYAHELASAGVTLMQYRNKQGSAREMLIQGRGLSYELRRDFAELKLIMNDRADICVAAGFDGVHLGQHDLPVEAARRICPVPMIIGTSTHNLPQLGIADQSDADYLAIGPVFHTVSKKNPDPVIGLDVVREARKRTAKPLVAIGGITLENCRSVIDAGADSVAVISALLNEPGKSAAAFLRHLG